MSDSIPDYSSVKDLTEPEFRVLLWEKLRSISVNQCNHLKHHWAITLICVTAALMGLVNLGLAFAVIFIKGG